MHILRYPGSKCKLAPEFWKRMPYFTEYREPCLGSASVLAHVFDRCEEAGRKVHFWGNDLNHVVMSVWWALKQGQPFIDEITAIINAIMPAEEHLQDIRTLFEEAK